MIQLGNLRAYSTMSYTIFGKTHIKCTTSMSKQMRRCVPHCTTCSLIFSSATDTSVLDSCIASGRNLTLDVDKVLCRNLNVISPMFLDFFAPMNITLYVGVRIY